MKTLFELCEPRPDILTGAVKESEFAADLAQVLRGEGPAEYLDPAVFFANTHPTDGLKRLLDNVCRRLSGTGGEASSIFRLDTQYGGGKTHALIAIHINTLARNQKHPLLETSVGSTVLARILVKAIRVLEILRNKRSVNRRAEFIRSREHDAQLGVSARALCSQVALPIR